MNKELPSCSGCEHEYECVNMVCFYELLEKEKQKIRADAIDELEDAIINAFDDNNEKWTVISFLQKVHEIAQKQLKEQ